MSARSGLFLFVLLVAILAAPTSHADARPGRVAFAVVIGNNRSLGHRRPDLHYADDDAAKYFAILRTVAPERVSLLADFDDDLGGRVVPPAGLAATSKSAADTTGAVSLGLGVLSLAYGTYTLAHSWTGERLAADYLEAEARGDYAHAFALANERLDAMASVESRERWGRRVTGGLCMLAGAAGIVGSEIGDASAAARFDARTIGGAVAVLGITVVASTFLIESPIERLTTVWHRDPSLVHIQPTVAPTQGGATLGLIGTF